MVTARTTPPFGILPFHKVIVLFSEGAMVVEDMLVINTGNPEGNSDYWVTSSRGDSRILWGWHRGAKIQSGGAMGKVMCPNTSGMTEKGHCTSA